MSGYNGPPEDRTKAPSEDDVSEDAGLIEAQKLETIGLVAGGVAHDFNNLLTVIVGRTALALMKLKTSDPARADLDEVLVAARAATQLTRQLLAYTGRGRFEVRVLDVSERVHELLELLSASLPKGARVLRQFSPRLPSVEADLGQLQQVIMNLMINASESLTDGIGTITVRTGLQNVDTFPLPGQASKVRLLPGPYVYIEVSDTGRGFDEATRARIVEPFFSTKAAGRGLGLAAVNGILRAHRGALCLTSQPGLGSTFRALLPASKQAADIASRSSFAVHMETGGTVLVVDDERAVRDVARATLEHIGYQVIEANGVEDAVATFAARQSEIDIVLLDMTMPDGNGAVACERIRKLAPQIPVVLSSGFHEQESAARLLNDGRTTFLAKPYTPAQCATCFVTLLDRIRTAAAQTP